MRAFAVAFVALTQAVACAGAAPPVSTVAPSPLEAQRSAAASPTSALANDASAAGPALAAETADASAADAFAPASACNEQPPQAFLIRGNFLRDGTAGNQRAIQYRTEQYGYFKGFGRAPKNADPPSAFAVKTTFFGLPVVLHRKVISVLKCVEEDIRRTCEQAYTPHALAGIRMRNTYRGGEVTNHAYGIAIDIDPSENTCCGCVKPWSDAPACKRVTQSEYDHMAMPECWVHAFERYGFYWLGHDVLKDTMHFEFLGDPDRIIGGQPPGDD